MRKSEFVDMREESFLISGSTSVHYKSDGRILAESSNWGDRTEEPLEDWLAGKAIGLISRARR